MSATISDAAFNLIVTEEDSDEAYYTKHYQHFEYPGFASGPTIGIGYDCGYVTPLEARMDWDGILPQDMIDHVVAACGLKGNAAREFVLRYGQSVTVTWDQAITEFRNREIPKWIKRVQNALPNTDKLSPDSLGALVSLSYNRGTGGYSDPHPRDAEMRSLRAHMALMRFDEIPGDIQAMRRLWPPPGSGLWKRRTQEAALFQKGLAVA